MENVDLFIIGGGINGCGIARDASGRGLSVVLCEQNDLGSSTSSASTKLIHGGLRYLEYGEFRLVRKALKEREILLAQAPHIIAPLEFIIPHTPYSRPDWLVRFGLFLYDHLSKRSTLAASKKIDLRTHPSGEILHENNKTGFSYADCWVDDSRLVILNALAAHQQGAQIYPRMRFVKATRHPNYWEIVCTQHQKTFYFKARVLLNAAGPWVNNVANLIPDSNIPQKSLRLVQGSHIVVSKLFANSFAYLLQQPNQRVIFVIPYQENFTLIGTTEIPCEKTDSFDQVKITGSEIQYLCQAVNHYFKKNLSEKDIKWEFSGVRPLIEDYHNTLSGVTRDYELLFDDAESQAPYLAVYGGKITVYRQLAENVLILLKKVFPKMPGPWTEKTFLPGGKNVKNHLFYENFIIQKYPNLPKRLIKRWVRSYGSLIFKLLQNAQNIEDLGQAVSEDLYLKEIEYLVKEEWAQTAEDILWRRTKLGLTFTETQKDKLNQILNECSKVLEK